MSQKRSQKEFCPERLAESKGSCTVTINVNKFKSKKYGSFSKIIN
jgi:hypothetical protein